MTLHQRVLYLYHPPSEGGVSMPPPHPKVVYLNDPPSEGGVFI